MAKKVENNPFAKPTDPKVEDNFPRIEPKVMPTGIKPAERDENGNRVKIDFDPVVTAAATQVSETPIDEPTPSASERMDAMLGATAHPMSKTLIEATRVGLRDISPEEQLELAIEMYMTLGKAAGFLPDFHSLSENMKAAHLKAVRDVWLAAQRKVRGFNE